jgi:hypothetical protein
MHFILLIYLLFGLINGGMIAEGFKGRFTWPVGGIFAFLAANIVAVFFAWLLARSSNPKEDGSHKYGLSPGGWGIGLSIAYVVGFVAGIFVA